MSTDTVELKNQIQAVPKLDLRGSSCISTYKKYQTERQGWSDRYQNQGPVEIIKKKTSQSKMQSGDVSLNSFYKLSQRISELQSIVLQDQDFQEKFHQSILSSKSNKQFKLNWSDEGSYSPEYVLYSPQQLKAQAYQQKQKQEYNKMTQSQRESPFKNLFQGMQANQSDHCGQNIVQSNSCPNCTIKDRKIKELEAELEKVIKQLKIITQKKGSDLDDSIQRQNQQQNKADQKCGKLLFKFVQQTVPQPIVETSTKTVKNGLDYPAAQSQKIEILNKEKECLQIFGKCRIHQDRYVKKICLNLRCKKNRYLCEVCQQQAHLIHQRVQINGPQMEALLSSITSNSLNEQAAENYQYFRQKAQTVLKMFKQGIKKLRTYQVNFYSKCTPVLNCIKQSFNSTARKQAEYFIRNGNLLKEDLSQEKVEYYVGIMNQNKNNNVNKYASNVISMKRIIEYHVHLFSLSFKQMFNLIDSNMQESLQKFEQLNTINEEVQQISRSYVCLKQNAYFDQIQFKKIHLTPNTSLPGFKNGFKIKGGSNTCVYSGIGSAISKQPLPCQGCYTFTIRPIKLNTNKRIYIGLVSEDHINNINNIGKTSVTYRLETRTIYRFDKQIKAEGADNMINETPMLIDIYVNINRMKIIWIFNGRIQASCDLPEQWIADKKNFYAEVYLSTENDIFEFR